MLPQKKIGDIEQGLPRMAVADPTARVAPHPVVQGESGPQQRNLQTFGDFRTVRIAHQHLSPMRRCRTLEILQIADLNGLAGQIF